MFRERLYFDERANAIQESAQLAARARMSGLSEHTIAEICASFEPLLTELTTTGRLLKSQGSQIVVNRKISGRGYNISFHFSVNEKVTLFSQLLRFIGLR